ncbi:uncharacterized protein PHACADRAFT_88964 [Phanerochaete carnosa HHB-10118-sp]|uniref:Uncharacterized protein n=1 Tax=Phanerochaete carnosa (strain HHB-10118-sp) TaxID=650164 RepID=K5WE40_PHACS|nr:uncharacterized protein PHACADRAFT_88964 [Phanerochaete carnosa HHB-10118-sp]EKM57565.1 hypothetical protein PHACADRAFT_88964 [Phanerochaete carnosa HHB-10118-sp]
MIRCSESRNDEGSSSRYTLALLPSASTMATRWSSPPESVLTSWSMMFSRLIGLTTSVWNCGCMNAALICFRSSIRTVPGNLGEMACGLSETESSWRSVSTSGVSPARRRTNVVFPMPFSPSMTMISESVKLPGSTVSLKPPILSIMISSAVSTILNERDSSRNRKFSVGMKPSKKMLIPSRTE